MTNHEDRNVESVTVAANSEVRPSDTAAQVRARINEHRLDRDFDRALNQNWEPSDEGTITTSYDGIQQIISHKKTQIREAA